MQTRKDLSGPCTLSYRVTNKGYWRREVRVQIVGDDLMCRATNKQCKSGHWVWQSASSDLPYLILISPQIAFFMSGREGDQAWRPEEFPHFTRWQEAMLARESVKKVVAVLMDKEVKSS